MVGPAIKVSPPPSVVVDHHVRLAAAVDLGPAVGLDDRVSGWMHAAGAQPHIGARRDGGRNICAAPEPLHHGSQMCGVPGRQGVPVIDGGQQHRPHPDRHLVEQPSGLLAGDRTVGCVGLIHRSCHDPAFQPKTLHRIVRTGVKFEAGRHADRIRSSRSAGVTGWSCAIVTPATHAPRPLVGVNWENADQTVFLREFAAAAG